MARTYVIDPSKGQEAQYRALLDAQAAAIAALVDGAPLSAAHAAATAALQARGPGSPRVRRAPPAVRAAGAAPSGERWRPGCARTRVRPAVACDCAQAGGQGRQACSSRRRERRLGRAGFHARPRCRPPAGGAPRGPGGLRRRGRARAQERGQADLAERLPKAVGWGMGLEFRESHLQLTADMATPARPGMVFNVTLGARPGRGAPARRAPAQPMPSE